MWFLEKRCRAESGVPTRPVRLPTEPWKTRQGIHCMFALSEHH